MCARAQVLYWSKYVSPGTGGRNQWAWFWLVHMDSAPPFQAVVEETPGASVWSRRQAAAAGPKGSRASSRSLERYLSPSPFLQRVSPSVFPWSKSSVKGKVSESVIQHHITGANWAARPGFGSVWSDFLKKDFRISPEQEIKAGVRRDSVFFPTFSFDDVSPGGLTVLVVKQESFP